jgi:hypothetical protein
VGEAAQQVRPGELRPPVQAGGQAGAGLPQLPGLQVGDREEVARPEVVRLPVEGGFQVARRLVRPLVL